MKLDKIDFADSQLKKINIEYDKLEVYIQLDDNKKTDIVIKCTGLIGIDNLCIWDDTYIDKLSIMMANRKDNYMQEVFKSYISSIPGRDLNRTIFDLRITLVNNITCHIYCQSFDLYEKN